MATCFNACLSCSSWTFQLDSDEEAGGANGPPIRLLIRSAELSEMLSRAAKQLAELYREKNTCMEAGCKSSVYVGYSNCAGCNGRFCSKHLRYITFFEANLPKTYCRTCSQCQEPGCQEQASNICTGCCVKFICPEHLYRIQRETGGRFFAVCEACKDRHEKEEQLPADL